MDSFHQGFFVMLNPGDLLTGFGPFTSFHKCCKGQRISKLLTQWGKGWPGLRPALTSALRIILFYTPIHHATLSWQFSEQGL